MSEIKMYSKDDLKRYILRYEEKNRIMNEAEELTEIAPMDFYRKVFGSGILRSDKDSRDDGKCCAIIKYRTGIEQYKIQLRKIESKYQEEMYDCQYNLDDLECAEELKDMLFSELDMMIQIIVHEPDTEDSCSRLMIIYDCLDSNKELNDNDVCRKMQFIIKNFIKDVDDLDRKFHKDKYASPKFNNQVTTGTTWSNQVYDGLNEIELGINNIQANLSPVGFYGNKANSNNASLLFAFNIDIDYVAGNNLENVIKGIRNETYPIPTLLVNTGIGIHIWYVLDAPLKLKKSVREDISKFKQRLVDLLWNEKTSRSKDKDFQGYMQDSRVVGSQTKLGAEYLATGYIWKDGKTVSIDYLKSFVTKDKDGNDLPELNLIPVDESQEDIAALKEKMIDILPDYKDNIMDRTFTSTMLKKGIEYPEWFVRKVLGEGETKRLVLNEKTYYNFLEEIILNIRIGYRYKMVSMLYVLGIKCDIKKEMVTEHIMGILPIFNENCPENLYFTEADIKAASYWYKQESLTHTREYVYKFSGIPMKQTVKRNAAYNCEGKTQQEVHLEKARAIAKERGTLGGRPKASESKYKDRIVEYISSHDKYNKAQISRELGINRKTVARWLSAAEEEIKSPKNICDEKKIKNLTPYEKIREKYSNAEKILEERRKYNEKGNQLCNDEITDIKGSKEKHDTGDRINNSANVQEKTGLEKIRLLFSTIEHRRKQKEEEIRQKEEEIRQKEEDERWARIERQRRYNTGYVSGYDYVFGGKTAKEIQEEEKNEQERINKEKLETELDSMEGVIDKKGRKWVLYSSRLIYVDYKKCEITWNITQEKFRELIERVNNTNKYSGSEIGTIVKAEAIRLCSER